MSTANLRLVYLCWAADRCASCSSDLTAASAIRSDVWPPRYTIHMHSGERTSIAPLPRGSQA